MAEELQGQPAAQGGSANVKFGMYSRSGQWAGKSVKQLKDELKRTTQWEIDENTKIFRGKTELGDNEIVADSDNLELVRRMGEKG